MKKILIPLILIITIYSVYYDLNNGTLPTSTITPAPNSDKTNSVQEIPAEQIVVEPGYTVLSIVEELHSEPVNASIQQIIHDFEILNPGISADKIEIGTAYYFPVYNK